MVEVEGLKVVIAAEIRDAIENIRKVNDAFSNLTAKIKTQAPNLTAFLTKWKLGWVAVGLASIAGLYQLAKNSAYLSLWFAEATNIVGYFADEALAPLQPLFDVISKALWAFGDAFASLPEPIKAAVGAIILALGSLKIIDVLFKTGFATKLLGLFISTFETVKTAVLGIIERIGISMLGAIAAGIGIGITVTWLLDKLGIIKAIDEAGRTIETKIPEIFNLLKILTAPLAALGSVIINIVRGETDRIIPDLRRIFGDAIYAAFDVFPNAFRWISEQGRGFRQWAGYGEKYNIPSRQMGESFIPETGLYKLHRGEAVIPRGKSASTGSTINFSPTINILNPQIKSDMDIRQLANQLTSYWRDDMQRYVRGVVA